MSGFAPRRNRRPPASTLRDGNPNRVFDVPCSLSIDRHATLQLGERFRESGLIGMEFRAFAEGIVRIGVATKTGKSHRIPELRIRLPWIDRENLALLIHRLLQVTRSSECFRQSYASFEVVGLVSDRVGKMGDRLASPALGHQQHAETVVRLRKPW